MEDSLFDIPDFIDTFRIDSEQSLFSDNNGSNKYCPIYIETFSAFQYEVETLENELVSFISEVKWSKKGGESRDNLFFVYQHIGRHLSEFDSVLLKLYKSVYITITYNFQDEIRGEYEKHLLSLFSQIKQFEFEEDYHGYNTLFNMPVMGDIYNKLTDSADENSEYNRMSIDQFLEHVLDSSNIYRLERIKGLINDIEKIFVSINQIRFNRSKDELCIIYQYIRKEYMTRKSNIDLQRFAQTQKGFFERRCLAPDSKTLRELYDNMEGKHKEYNLCRIWDEHRDYEFEECIYQLEKQQAYPTEFETLFKYQAIMGCIEEQIAKRVEYERKGDPMFAIWVDAEKLEDYLEPWLKGNIDSQQKWYIPWCLMKYTHGIIRDGITKAQFSERMLQMFPNVEKRCVEDSFRKFENKQNHNRHFSEWYESDPDYQIANRLNELLKEKERYKRESDLMFT